MVVARPNYESNAWDSDLVLVDLRTRAQRTMTQRKTASAPRWSPGGDHLAFLARVDGQAQIFVMPADGGEARQVTRAPHGVSTYAWKPDGTALAFAAAPEGAKRQKFDDSFEVDANDYLTQSAPRTVHLYTIAASGGEAKPVANGEWSVPTLFATLDWSRDGRSLVFTRQKGAGTRNWEKRSLAVADVATGTVAAIAGLDKRSCYLAWPSLDGSALLASCPVDGHVKNQSELVVLPSAGGTPRRLTAALDRNMTRGAWSADSRQVFVLRPGAAAPERLTDLHAEVAALSLGKVESLTWTGDGALPLSGVITFPPAFDPARKYPLLLVIHGGPWASSRETFSARTQLLAAKGWIVFEPNYRGSDNAGNALYSAVYRDHGAGPGRDVMAGLTLLKQRPYVDTTRIGVSGWSYGGYMTTWLIGHYQGWKAAMAGAAVIDLVDDYNLNDLSLFIRAYGDTLTFPKDLELMKEQSPMTYVDDMKTPLLLLSTTGDVRVPVTQSYKLYNALRERGQDVRMRLWPVPGHFPADPWRARDIDQKWAEFFEDRFR
jgi:dipeptidyl aminopeptidase/acylaminoacyl peptidase